jgi:carboxyl-terminal processing protease
MRFRRRFPLPTLAGIAVAIGTCMTSVHAAGQAPSTVPLETRMEVASRIRVAVTTYFAHWQGIPDEDFDKDYATYLKAIAHTDDRRDFDFATLALFADLGNSHSNFQDTWLTTTDGDRTGLRVVSDGGPWIVRDTMRAQVPVGSLIVSVDGRPVEDFFKDMSRYIAASSDRSRRERLFNTGYLFPKVFSLGLGDGRTVRIDRAEKGSTWAPHKPPALPDGVVYTRIEGFDKPAFEQDAVAFVLAHRDAKAMIVDVRGNGGGNTPSDLIHALMDRPYRDWSEASAMSVGLLNTYAQLADRESVKADPETHGFYEGFQSYFSRPMMLWPGTLQKPEHPVYRGKLIILVDRVCISACEDFVMPFKVSGRATIVGETTAGSSGQPYMADFGNGMSFRVSAKRMSFGDGSPFEGVGIHPDVDIVPTATQLKAGEDPVLARAIQLAGG